MIKKLSNRLIGLKLRQGKTFQVYGKAQRQAVLAAASFNSINVATRNNGNGGFNVYILK